MLITNVNSVFCWIVLLRHYNAIRMGHRKLSNYVVQNIPQAAVILNYHVIISEFHRHFRSRSFCQHGIWASLWFNTFVPEMALVLETNFIPHVLFVDITICCNVWLFWLLATLQVFVSQLIAYCLISSLPTTSTVY